MNNSRNHVDRDLMFSSIVMPLSPFSGMMWSAGGLSLLIELSCNGRFRRAETRFVAVNMVTMRACFKQLASNQ
jgi:hypothetical protein